MKQTMTDSCKAAGLQEAETNTRQGPVHLPGAGASTFSGRGVFHSLLRMMMRSRCRLGSFARSFVTRHSDCLAGSNTAQKEIFPLPNPYPEVFRKKTAADDRKCARKKGVVALVITLNFLHLNRPRQFGPGDPVHKKLNKKQWEAVKRFEFFLEGWTTAPPVTPEEMGRCAAKVESLEEMLTELSRQASSLAKSGGSYFSHAPQSDQPGRPLAPKEPEIGMLKGDAMTTFKQVDASRLSFPGRPSFDPRPYLDPNSSLIYEDPLTTRMAISECPHRPPKLKVHCSKSEKIKLFDLLDSSNRLRIHLPHETTPDYGSGLFAVPKDMNRDRLILDSRGANLLESPPRRWIRALGSSEVLSKIHLEPDEVLKSSGNDLKDFYYLFKTSSSRSRRNVLVGPLHPKELTGISAVKEHHLQSNLVYGSLNTLAMGDTQAVELAQSCHVGLALQGNILTCDNMTSLYQPLPREDTMVGIIIDDFISMSKVKCGVEDRSRGAQMADEMQAKYEDVGLMPNTKKAFRDQEEASFWGVDIDGRKGLLRGSLRRAIPLAGLLLKLAQIGACTGSLMQILAGSVISLCLYRRRLLSLLDSLFDSYRGRADHEIFRLNGRTQSDLIMLATLLPMACVNLRATTPSLVAAADASNWGEAGVVAKIPRAIGKELVRHSLRKSVWTKLLSPAAARLRGHGCLDEAEELPDSTEVYQSNDLWALLADGLHYKELFSKAKSGPRHINIGEVRGALKTEKILSTRNPSSRTLMGLDSQVALGALIKGRSASAAINAELSRSIPWMLSNDSYLELMYYNTKLNRADQPTRGQEIEEPKTPCLTGGMPSSKMRTFRNWTCGFLSEDWII